MIKDIQLAAIVVTGQDRKLYRVPLTQDVQKSVGEQWFKQLAAFTKDATEMDFDAGYTPEAGELFRVKGFEPPAWLASQSSQTLAQLPSLSQHEKELDRVKGIAALAKVNGKDLVLFQNFSRSHILRPGLTLFLQKGTYQDIDTSGLSLNDHLAGIWYVEDKRLVFASYRAMNVIVPLVELYREAGEKEIREVLGNKALAPEDVDAIAKDPSQWFQKRFALLKDSEVLTNYTPKQIQTRGRKFQVSIKVKDGKLVFPKGKTEAKRLLQFLNEELFHGAITEKLYSTNSKKAE